MCVTCPPGSYSGAESSLLTNCTCNVGFFGLDGGPCAACPAGTFKHVNGSAACSFCPQGKFSMATGQTSESTCITCPPLSISPVQGSSSILNCTCVIGHTGSGHNCSACLAGTYKNVTGSLPCLGCIGGTYSPPSSSTCLVCPENSLSAPNSTDVSNCLCNAGFTKLPGGGCAMDLSPEAQAAVTGVTASVTAGVAVAVGAAVTSAIVTPITSQLAQGVVSATQTRDSPLDIVFLLYHVQFITFLGDVGGNNTSSLAVRKVADSFRWSLYDFGLFSHGQSTFESTLATEDPANRRSQTCSTTSDLLRIAGRIVTCVGILVLVMMVRASLRALLPRVQSDKDSDKDWTALNYPAWEFPTVLSQFWGVTEALTQTFGRGCTPISQMVSGCLVFGGPGLLCVMLATHVHKMQKDGIFQYQASAPAEGHPETGQGEMLGSRWRDNIKLFKVRLMSSRFRGSWNEDDPRVRPRRVLLESFTGSCTLFFALQLLRHMWISCVIVLTTGAASVMLLIWAQMMEILIIFCYMPYVDMKNNCLEGLSALFNTAAVVCIALPIYSDGAQLDDVLLVIMSCCGTIVVVLGNLIVTVGGLYRRLRALKQAQSNKILDDAAAHGTLVSGLQENTDEGTDAESNKILDKVAAHRTLVNGLQENTDEVTDADKLGWRCVGTYPPQPKPRKDQIAAKETAAAVVLVSAAENLGRGQNSDDGRVGVNSAQPTHAQLPLSNDDAAARLSSPDSNPAVSRADDIGWGRERCEPAGQMSCPPAQIQHTMSGPPPLPDDDDNDCAVEPEGEKAAGLANLTVPVLLQRARVMLTDLPPPLEEELPDEEDEKDEQPGRDLRPPSLRQKASLSRLATMKKLPTTESPSHQSLRKVAAVIKSVRKLPSPTKLTTPLKNVKEAPGDNIQSTASATLRREMIAEHERKLHDEMQHHDMEKHR
jgi:hypothetical protein